MKVKNISGQTLTIVDVGVVQPDEVINVPDNFNNTNFEPEGTQRENKKENQKENKSEQKKDADEKNSDKQ